MDDEPVLLPVKDAGQGVGLLSVPVEQTSLVDVHDQNAVAVDHLRGAPGLDRVRPRVQVPAEPLRQSARLGNRIPEVVECLDRPTAQVNDQLAIRPRSRLTSPGFVDGLRERLLLGSESTVAPGKLMSLSDESTWVLALRPRVCSA